MSNMIHFLKRNSLVTGITLMFLLTWPIDLAYAGVMPFQVPFVVYIFLGWGFIFASLIMTGLTLGRDAVIALLKRYLIWRVGWRWYLVAFLLIPVLDLLAIYLYAAWSRTPVNFSTVIAYEIFGPSANLILLFVPFFIFDAISNGEDMGWRGYVLPRLQARYSALVSSLIVGMIWGLWHFPKTLSPMSSTPFLFMVMDTTVKSVIYTWLYNNTGGSLLLVTLFHAAGNTAGLFLPTTTASSVNGLNTFTLVLLLEVIVAVIVVIMAGPARLSRSEPRQVQTRLPDVKVSFVTTGEKDN